MDDLISRQDAIDALIEWYGCEPSDIGAFEDIIEKMPSVQPEPQWIPCTERLPEKSGRYLVTRKFNALFSLWDKVDILNYSDLMGLKKEKIWWSGNVGKSDFEKFDDVIAWMPLPEPYKTNTKNEIVRSL